MQARSRLWIIIVNYRTAPLVLDSLKSLSDERSHCLNMQVVVDNASKDGSFELLNQGITDYQ
jgi:GT2 family glycosyltransferase